MSSSNKPNLKSLSCNILIHKYFVLCVSLTMHFTNYAKCHTYNAILMKWKLSMKSFIQSVCNCKCNITISDSINSTNSY